MKKYLFILFLVICTIASGQGRYFLHMARLSETTYEEDLWYGFENNTSDYVGGDSWSNTSLTFSTSPTPQEGSYIVTSNDNAYEGQLPSSFTNSFPSNFTIMFWAYPTSNITGWRPISSGTPYTSGFQIRISVVGTDFDVFTDGVEVNANNFDANVLNTWHHYAVTYQSSTGTINIVIDGTARTTGASGSSGVTLTGTWLFMDNAVGHMDDLRIYPSVLSTSDINTIYSNPDDPL